MSAETDHTFCVLAYGDSPHIEACILSLINQTTKSRIIICTSTPSPYLEKIAQEYDLELQVNPVSRGIAADWTFAYHKAQTRYVTLAHQDDKYYAEFVEKTMDSLIFHSDALIGFTDYDELRAGTLARISTLTVIKKLLLAPLLLKRAVRGSFWKTMILKFGSPIACPTVTFDKDNCGQFSFDPTYTVNLDWAAWIELSKRNGAFVYMPQKLLAHRIHSHSETTVAIHDNRRLREDLAILQLLWGKTLGNIVAKIYSASYKFN